MVPDRIQNVPVLVGTFIEVPDIVVLKDDLLLRFVSISLNVLPKFGYTNALSCFANSLSIVNLVQSFGSG